MAISFVQISIELFETLKVLASQLRYVFQSDNLSNGSSSLQGRYGGRMLKRIWCSVSKMESLECHWIGMKCDVFPKKGDPFWSVIFWPVKFGQLFYAN